MYGTWFYGKEMRPKCQVAIREDRAHYNDLTLLPMSVSWIMLSVVRSCYSLTVVYQCVIRWRELNFLDTALNLIIQTVDWQT